MITKEPNKDSLAELNKYRRETNAIFYSLSKNLMTLAVLAMTVSPAFTSRITSNNAKFLYVCAMGAALVSVFAGIAQYYRDCHGFMEYVGYLEAKEYHDDSGRTKKQQVLVKRFSHESRESATFNTGHAWLVIQLFAVLTSLSMILIVVILNYLSTN